MSRYLIDTNVLSELRKQRKNVEVLRVLYSLPGEATFISALSVGEIELGARRKQMRDAEQAALIFEWVRTIEEQYAGRILPVDVNIAKMWATFSSHPTRPIIDTMLAATAAVHDLTVVTRNVTDFQDFPVRILDPWKG